LLRLPRVAAKYSRDGLRGIYDGTNVDLAAITREMHGRAALIEVLLNTVDSGCGVECAQRAFDEQMRRTHIVG
jgi:hypothetical protein